MRKKHIKHSYNYVKKKVAILIIVIFAVSVISVLLYSSGVFSQRLVYVKFTQSGLTVSANANQIYNTTLNATSYKVYELNIPKNSSTEYVASEIQYNIMSNSTLIYSFILSKRQLNLFQKGDSVYQKS